MVDKEKVDLRLEKEKLDLDKSYLESKSNLERSQSGNERKSGREGVETSFGRGGGGQEVGDGGQDVVSLDRAVKEDQRVLRGVEGTKSGEDSSERVALPLEPTVRIETR